MLFFPFWQGFHHGLALACIHGRIAIRIAVGTNRFHGILIRTQQVVQMVKLVTVLSPLQRPGTNAVDANHVIVVLKHAAHGLRRFRIVRGQRTLGGVLVDTSRSRTRPKVKQG
jgi:hypothetical protein